jgi:regulator of protease activity HflC (stomatin/prohibitin superfamily)
MPALREFVGAKEFEELIRIKESSSEKEKAEEEFCEFLNSSQIDEFILKNYGVEIRKAELVNVDPSGDRAISYVEAASKSWEAQREKERIKVIADAEVERLDRVYGKIKQYGDMGLFIKATEAIQEVGKGQSNLVVFPFGSAQSMIEGWLGKRKKGEEVK